MLARMLLLLEVMKKLSSMAESNAEWELFDVMRCFSTAQTPEPPQRLASILILIFIHIFILDTSHILHDSDTKFTAALFFSERSPTASRLSVVHSRLRTSTPWQSSMHPCNSLDSMRRSQGLAWSPLPDVSDALQRTSYLFGHMQEKIETHMPWYAMNSSLFDELARLVNGFQVFQVSPYGIYQWFLSQALKLSRITDAGGSGGKSQPYSSTSGMIYLPRKST